MKLYNYNFNNIKKNILIFILIIICFLNLFSTIKAKEEDIYDNNVIPKEDLEEKIPTETNSNSNKSYKFLFMYKYNGVKNEPEHKLNLFTYKNILLSNDQLVFFESPNQNDPVKILYTLNKLFSIV